MFIERYGEITLYNSLYCRYLMSYVLLPSVCYGYVLFGELFDWMCSLRFSEVL